MLRCLLLGRNEKLVTSETAPPRGPSALNKTFRFSTVNIVRVMIASYVIGLGMNLFGGPSVSALFRQFGLGDAAPLVSGAVIVALGSLVFLDIARRPAAMALAALFAVVSLTALQQSAGAHAIGSFWRDILVMILILFTLRDPSDDEAATKRRASAHVAAPARGHADQVPDDTGELGSAPRHPRRVRTEIYRQDFDAVRVH